MLCRLERQAHVVRQRGRSTGRMHTLSRYLTDSRQAYVPSQGQLWSRTFRYSRSPLYE